MKEEPVEVGQAKIFSQAAISPKKSLTGTIQSVSPTSVEVLFSVDGQNGVRAMKSKFLRSQFGTEPTRGKTVRVQNGTVSMVE